MLMIMKFTYICLDYLSYFETIFVQFRRILPTITRLRGTSILVLLNQQKSLIVLFNNNKQLTKNERGRDRRIKEHNTGSVNNEIIIDR